MTINLILYNILHRMSQGVLGLKSQNFVSQKTRIIIAIVYCFQDMVGDYVSFKAQGGAHFFSHVLFSLLKFSLNAQ